MIRRLAVILSCLVAALGAASTTYVLPGAAETGGAHGSVWSSTLWALNPSGEAAVVSIGLIPGPGIAAPAPVTRTINPGETLRLDRPLALWPGQKAGSLLLTSTLPLVTLLSTRNIADAPKEYGQSLLSVGPADVIFAGETACIPWVDQRGGARGTRTNVGAVLLDGGTQVTLRAYDGMGVLKGSAQVESAVPVSWQAPISALIGAGDLPLGWIELEVVEGRASGYASVVDNTTSDGMTSQTLRLPEGPTDLYLGGVARTPGVNGSYWTTDLRLLNGADAEAAVTLKAFIAGGQHALTRTIPAKGVIELKDVLGPQGFNLGEGIAGAVKVTSDAPLLVAGRNANADPTGVEPGSFSSSIPAVPPGRFIQAGSTGYLAAIDQETGPTGTRTNLAVLGGPGGSTGTLILRDSHGEEWARRDYYVNHGQWTQKNVSQWFPDRAIPANARIDVAVAAGSVTGYASRNDNASGDATCIPLTPVSGCAEDVVITLLPWACRDARETASVPYIPGASYAWTISGGTLLSDPTANAVDYEVGRSSLVRLACSVSLGPDCTSTGTVTQTVYQPPRILTFWAYPSVINAGDSTTLFIAVQDGFSALLQPGGFYVELVDGVGTLVVSPPATTTYDLTAMGLCAPDDTDQTTVTVN